MSKYASRKAVVIGGSHGIGLAAVKALLAEDAEVLFTGNTPANLEAARRELGPRAHAVRADVTRLAELDALAAVVGRTLDVVDLVFFNAGHARIVPFTEVTEALYDQTFDVNTRGAFFAAQRLAPRVREGGAMLFTTSIADEMGYPGLSVYAGAKAAVRAFVRGLAVELAPRRVRVNALSPGFVATPTMGLAGASAEELAAFVKEGARLTPLGRIASPEEVARAVLFLGFEATFTTGAELTLDGGLLQV